MTATNPHPLANPFNRQRYIEYETCYRPKAVSKCDDPSKLQVPDSSMTYEQVQAALEAQKSLTVPYSAPDDIGGSVSFGFIGQTSFFRLHDGSVLDLKTHKIVLDPNKNFKAAGYWNDPGETINKPGLGEWGKTESITSLMAQYDAAGGNYDPNLSPESINYWNRAREESKKLEQNMTDDQKKLMADLNSEQFFPLSRLKEEA